MGRGCLSGVVLKFISTFGGTLVLCVPREGDLSHPESPFPRDEGNRKKAAEPAPGPCGG